MHVDAPPGREIERPQIVDPMRVVGVRVGEQHGVDVPHVRLDQLLAQVRSRVDERGRHAARADALDERRAAAAAVARIGGVARAPPLRDARARPPRSRSRGWSGEGSRPRAASAELREEPQRIGAGRGGERFGRDSFRFRDRPRGRGDERRLVALAAMGNRREVGRVGLDEDPVERHVARDGAQLARVLEGDARRKTRSRGRGRAPSRPARATR